MTPEVKIISKKASEVIVNRAGGVWGHTEHLSWGFRGQNPQIKFLGSKKHLDWLQIDLNAAKTTAQDSMHKKLM